MKKNVIDDNNIFDKKWVFGIILILLIIIGLWKYIPILLTSDLKLEDKGSYGDSYGSVNALFTGLAFAGLLLTIILQRNELRLQRTELQLQREEMQASRAELNAQVKNQERTIKLNIAQMEIERIKAEISVLEVGWKTRVKPDKTNEYKEKIDALISEMNQTITNLKADVEPTSECEQGGIGINNDTLIA